jgi:hypothetical protein
MRIVVVGNEVVVQTCTPAEKRSGRPAKIKLSFFVAGGGSPWKVEDLPSDFSAIERMLEIAPWDEWRFTSED